ncbi:hypothetical protein [Rhodococcus tibetensis]|uniref:Uncharacterized protein n=1 Tax=Rhodococcus tibetensis TaxID=2965064 RepID=A0ABT1QF61_9NOCA|nr:hypothetical protein [Rhodococcus sp. FXJ9.536]MCQ4120890.1 hypothetical protein [Rhodococcus sp. FXJ9.536]
MTANQALTARITELEVATDLFIERGRMGTSIRDEPGTRRRSVETVYSSGGNKTPAIAIGFSLIHEKTNHTVIFAVAVGALTLCGGSSTDTTATTCPTRTTDPRPGPRHGGRQCPANGRAARHRRPSHPGLGQARHGRGAVEVCAPNVDTADELRPIATQYATAVRNSSLGDQVSSMWVENYWLTDGDVTSGAELKVPNFHMFPWSGKPTPQAELQNWDILSE